MSEYSSTDFLRFSAYSMKDLITRKLSEDSKFTDQIYEGSNLAILIDLVSYMYQCLVYQLNNAASESMFSDTQIYENIVRLCKFIGYTPKGAQPAIMSFGIESGTVEKEVTIPTHSYIESEQTDSNGAKICFAVDAGAKLYQDRVNTLVMYNGRWKKYSTTITTKGVENETIQLDLDKDEVAWPFVDVYIKTTSNSNEKLCKRIIGSTFTYVDSNDGNRVKIYDKQSDNYAYRLIIDEFGKYGLEFGVGTTLPSNATLTIWYLKINSNVDSEAIELGSVSGVKFKNDDELESEKLSQIDSLTFMNTSTPSNGSKSETVDEIRQNAPMVNKIQNRLVTKYDYENFIKYMNASNIIDVVAQNNYEYMNTFYKWLYMLGLEKHQDSSYYLNEDRLSKYDYRFSDAADMNTVYLWIKTFNNSDIYFETLNNQIEDLKMITTEVCYIEPIEVNFAICGADDETAYNMIFTTGSVDGNSYIEVTLNENCLYSSSQLIELIKNKIVEFFDESKQRIGGKIAVGDLTNDIYSIGGIQNIKTIYSSGQTKFTRYGINFACWSSKVIDAGDDLFFLNGDKCLETFQFPVLDEDIMIKIIKRHDESITQSINY